MEWNSKGRLCYYARLLVPIKMNKTMIATYILIFQMLFAACVAPQKCVKGNGEVEERTLELAEFNSFMVGCSADVELKQGDVQRVIIVGESNILDMFNKDVENGMWRIVTDKCYQTKKGLKVMITVKDLERIKINGSGDVRSKGLIKTKDFIIDINGSGDVSMELDTEDLKTSINGSGDLLISGECYSMDINVNGSGDIDASELNTGDCDIEVNGSGDSQVNVTGHLRVNINGSGDVHYLGHPKSLEVDENGSGDVRDAN